MSLTTLPIIQKLQTGLKFAERGTVKETDKQISRPTLISWHGNIKMHFDYVIYGILDDAL